MTEDKDRGGATCAYQPHTQITILSRWWAVGILFFVCKGFNFEDFSYDYGSGSDSGSEYESCSESNMRYRLRKGYGRYTWEKNPATPAPLPCVFSGFKESIN